MKVRKVGPVNWEERVLETILDDAIDRLRDGGTVDEVVADYPEHSQELRPLLQTAEMLMCAERPHVRSQAYWRGRARLEEALRERPNGLHNSRTHAA